MPFQNELPPNTRERHQGRLAYLDDRLLPRNVLGPLWDKVAERSLVFRLGERVPVAYGETVMPISTVEPEVGQVGVGTKVQDREGHLKPVTGYGWDTQSFSPIKLAGIITVSEEFSRVDPRGLNSTLETKLVNAISRGVDLACFHNRRPDTGGLLLGTELNGFIAQTTKTVTLTPKHPDVPAGSPLKQHLIDGWEKVVEDDLDFDAWAVDKVFRPKLSGATNASGQALFGGEVDLGANRGTLLGLPVQYGNAVGGKIGANPRGLTRVFGGDWSRLLYGFADEVRIKRSTEGVITVGNETINLWQTNQVALMVECTFGWKVDPNAFVKYELPPATPAAATADQPAPRAARRAA